MTTTPTDTPPAADDLPDLRPIIASDEAAQAVEEVLAEYAKSSDTSHLGSLTDEELVVLMGGIEAVEPVGQWYPGLGEHPQRVSRATALRSLTSREEVIVTQDAEGDLSARVSRRLMALLRMRFEPVGLSAQSMTRQGPSWYVLRRVGDLWLREVVTAQGFHAFDLVRLDEDEELFFRGILGLLDHTTASSVDGLHQPGGGAPAPGEVMAFLARQRNVTQLALVPPGPDAEPEALVVVVDEQGGTTVGSVEGDGLVYSGAAPQDVLERYRAWRGAW